MLRCVAALAAACLVGACTADGPGGEVDEATVSAGVQSRDVYEVDALSRRPELSNRDDIGSVMEREYPRALQDAGIGGTVLTQFIIEPDGRVDMETAKVLESTHGQLSAATLKVMERFRFRPGQYDGENVRVRVEMPVTWHPAG